MSNLPTISLPAGFRIDEVKSLGAALHPETQVDAPLGPLAAFTGTWSGKGFNTIFRPESTKSPTPFPVPVGASDNVLELNLTTENLAFSSPLGNIPNRGMVQADVFLNGVPYVQSINDVTTPGQTVAIHFEPGIWLCVPGTEDPAEGQTVARMASIPHGTTINAQGTSSVINGRPTIPAVSITPFSTNTPSDTIRFASQTATDKTTPRIPQDLTSFIAAGTITQAILDDPNTVLREAIAGLNITSTTIINISTQPAAPLFGGGTDNIAFLLGDAAALANPGNAGPNAQTLKMNATFWIETVEHVIIVPPIKPGQPALHLSPELPNGFKGPVPKFLVSPPKEITAPTRIVFKTTQIQYSQVVFLNFNTLTWPHVSVATLVPSEAVPVPPSVWG
jgi:hypothetical protein